MTLPDERTRAVLLVESLIHELLRAPPSHRPALILALHRSLRHYPTRFDLEASARYAPGIWGSVKEFTPQSDHGHSNVKSPDLDCRSMIPNLGMDVPKVGT